MIKRFLPIALCLCFLLSLCSCIEEETEESLAVPELDAILEYRIDNDEYIRVAYLTDMGVWVKGDEITRVYLEMEEDYWGIFASRWGITDVCIAIYEVEGMGKETYLVRPTDRYLPALGRRIATMDEGYLNSTEIKFADTEETVTITDIRVTEGVTDDDLMYGTPEELLAFLKPEVLSDPAAEVYYEMENIPLRVSADTMRGTWETNGAKIPVRMELDEKVCHLRIYDTSGETEKCIFAGNGHMAVDDITGQRLDDVLVIDDFCDSMFYEGTVTEVTVRITVIYGCG